MVKLDEARKRFHHLMDELDKMMQDAEKDIEESLRNAFQMGNSIENKPFVYGFSMKLSSDGDPIISTFGDINNAIEGVREPIVDQILDESRGTLKVFAELPGVEKEEIKLQVFEEGLNIIAQHRDRQYNTQIPLKAKVDPAKSSASYLNGVLEITFQIKDKTNKGFSEIRID